jgi:hypothetical protein
MQREIPSIPATAGDRVTVDISGPATPGYWSISVTDDTNGQTFSTDQWYSGARISAEWATESDTDSAYCSGEVDGIANRDRLRPYGHLHRARLQRQRQRQCCDSGHGEPERHRCLHPVRCLGPGAS